MQKQWSNNTQQIGLNIYCIERTRQKLFVAKLGLLVKIKFPKASALFVACGIQLGGDRVKERSSA